MSSLDEIFRPLRFLKGIGPVRAESLAARGLRTAYDLLTWIPRRHYDRRLLGKIRDAKVGETATLQGVVLTMGTERTSKRRLTVFRITLGDETGEIEAVWFGQPYLEQSFRVGDVVIVSGKVDLFRGLQIKPEEYEILGGEGQAPIHVDGLIPAYPPVEGMGRKAFRRLVHDAVERLAPGLPEFLPAPLLRKRGLMGAAESVRAIHFPATEEEKERARRRLAYDEFFLLETGLALKRHGTRREAVGSRIPVSDALDSRIRLRFPFALTKAQERVVSEIRKDLEAPWPMNRLLQGDVGSGKTAVAAYLALAAIGNGRQAAVMAPTEILAEQHERTFRSFLRNSRVRIARIAGGRATKDRKAVREAVAAGEVDLVLGTHALLEEEVRFKDLAAVVIDEQQKFGVAQRATLRRKGPRPHVLVMTATPIPRTLALTLFGDLDVSVLDELPPGRRPVTTLLRPPTQREEALGFVRKLLREGRQAYFVSPLVEESETLRIQSAVELQKRLKRELDPHPVGLLHGRMKPDEKDEAMTAFREGRIAALVSTLVIEVGIDVPNATVMVIESPERFGLSQLHQLRGRIGRGAHDGYCLLLGEGRSDEARERLGALVATSDGFEIAEADLRIRGPGEFLGTRQSGLPEFRAANLAGDLQLLSWAKEDAFGLVDDDPALAARGHALLRSFLEARKLSMTPLVSVG